MANHAEVVMDKMYSSWIEELTQEHLEDIQISGEGVKTSVKPRSELKS